MSAVISCACCGREFLSRVPTRNTMCSSECRTESRRALCKSRAVDACERFWSKVDKSGGPDACWPWMAHVSQGGYGRFRINGESVTASRLAYEWTFGDRPLQVDHRCRNRRCCNPNHLRSATPKQNNENRSVQRNNITGARGVWLDHGRFRAQVRHNGRAIYLGTFDSIEEADTAVRAKRLELFTHNEIDRVGR